MEDWFVIVMFALIFGGSAIWGITDTVLKHRRKMAGLRTTRSAREDRLALEKAELMETVQLLQQRVAVLETIATDPARRTADEIERLR